MGEVATESAIPPPADPEVIRSLHPSSAWVRYPAKVTIDERSKLEREHISRLEAQLKAVCEVHAATSNALTKTEEQNVRLHNDMARLQQELGDTREKNAMLCQETAQMQATIDTLKDKLIETQERLSSLSSFQVQREALLKKDEERVQRIRQLEATESELRDCVDVLHKELHETSDGCDTWKRQAEAQLRCNELLREEIQRLKKQVSKKHTRKAQIDSEHAALVEENAKLQQQVARVVREVEVRDQMLKECEAEARRLKKERADAKRALQDEQDMARERELWLRTLRRENSELSETLAAIRTTVEQQEKEAQEEALLKPSGMAKPVPVVEVGKRAKPTEPAPPPSNTLLEVLKKQNALQMKAMSNTLQQLLHAVNTRTGA